MSIIAECPGWLQVFSDGTIKRFSPDISNTSAEFVNGCKSKDVVIDPSKPITARIFVPDVGNSSTPLPLMVYHHGGGFCIGSTTWRGYHEFLTGLSITSKSIIVSVDYRLAPENRLPVAYDDCCGSLEWLAHNVGKEPWLEFADMSRVFLAGDSAGANICHNLALRAVQSNVQSKITLKGIVSIHPYFGSEKRIQSELADGAEEGVRMNDMFWWLSLPVGAGRDFHGCNYETAWPPEKVWPENFPAVLVCIAGKDLLKERGLLYEEFLRKKGVKEVEMILAEDEEHVYHVFAPFSEATKELQNKMAGFMARV